MSPIPRFALALCACAFLASPAISQARLPVTSFAGGFEFACVYISGEGVSCLGSNGLGQLGDGTTINRATPVSVQGLETDLVSVSAGTVHACALLPSGYVKCWGYSAGGDIGDGTFGGTKPPTTVVGLPGNVLAISVGNTTSCAVTRSGELKCWGTTLTGASNPPRVSAPLTVPGLERDVIGVSVGVEHACALLSGGAVRCWGSNSRGALGDGTMTSRATPALVEGWSSGVTAVAAGAEQTCAIRAGLVECVGVVDYVDFRDVMSTRPVPVAGISDAVALAAGVFHTCALTRGGHLKCWGFNRFGQLGDGGTTPRYRIAQDVQGITGPFTAMEARAEYTCAATQDGRAACWGNDRWGIGNGTVQTAPVDIAFPNYQGLWWKAPAGSESGWGLNISHQGSTLFATWFTYDTDGTGLWLVMPNGARTSERRFSGAIYRTRGSSLGTAWRNDAVRATPVGTATFDFADSQNGTFTYTVNGATQSKEITRQIFGTPPTCVFGGAPAFPVNTQDLWWSSPAGSESGWGLNVAHQGNILFITWFTYRADGEGQWFVMPNAAQVSSIAYTGEVFRTRGPALQASPWRSADVQATRVGTATFNLLDVDNATFNFTVDGVTESKRITRQLFAHPRTRCR